MAVGNHKVQRAIIIVIQTLRSESQHSQTGTCETELHVTVLKKSILIYKQTDAFILKIRDM